MHIWLLYEYYNSRGGARNLATGIGAANRGANMVKHVAFKHYFMKFLQIRPQHFHLWRARCFQWGGGMGAVAPWLSPGTNSIVFPFVIVDLLHTQHKRNYKEHSNFSFSNK